MGSSGHDRAVELEEVERLRQALEESEEKLTKVFESTGVFVAMTTLEEGRFFEVNQNFLDALGYTREEVIGKTSAELGIFPNIEERPEIVAKVLASDGPAQLDQTLRTKHGELREGLFSVSVIQLDGRPTLMAVMNDITERRRAEQARSESEHRYRMVSELTSDYAYAYRVDEDGSLENEWVTGALKRITGYDREEVKARGGWESLIFPEDLQIPLGQLKRLLAGEADVVEYRIMTRSGEQRWMRDHARPVLDEQGRVTHIYGAVQDITEPRQALEARLALEAKIQQAQKLESLGVLAGGIAHDFNNLLVGILGNADLALMDLAPESPARSSIEDILAASKRAADLVRQLLAYSGKGRFVVEALDLRKLVEEMAHLLEVSISKKVALEYDFSDEVPPIEADATQVRQVVMNLITNASEAIGQRSGVISLQVGALECSASYLAQTIHDEGIGPGRYSFVEISDTGAGLDEQTRARIFDPFYTTKFTGRGLGLAAVLGIVRGHRGAIKVYSVPGEGTSFKVLFPAARTGAAAARPQAGRIEAAFDGRTVLLVDDEATVRQVGARMLQRLGCEVLLATDGREAISVFEREGERVDLVLLDLTMPHMDGEECFRELRQLRGDVRVVLSSGYSEQDLNERFAGQGLAGVVQKPFRVQALAELLRAAFGERPQ